MLPNPNPLIPNGAALLSRSRCWLPPLTEPITEEKEARDTPAPRQAYEFWRSLNPATGATRER
jgi:hypothetical protein